MPTDIWILYMPIKKYRRQLHDDASSDSSVSSREISPSVSGAEPIILAPASRDYLPIITFSVSPTMDPDTTDETLYSPASPMVQATGDIEQPSNLGSTDQLQRYTRVNLTCMASRTSKV